LREAAQGSAGAALGTVGDLGLVQGEVAEDLFFRNLRGTFRKVKMDIKKVKRNLKHPGSERKMGFRRSSALKAVGIMVGQERF